MVSMCRLWSVETAIVRKKGATSISVKLSLRSFFFILFYCGYFPLFILKWLMLYWNYPLTFFLKFES